MVENVNNNKFIGDKIHLLKIKEKPGPLDNLVLRGLPTKAFPICRVAGVCSY